MNLRPAKRTDLDELVRLERDCFGAEAWSPAMVLEEITGLGRAYFVIEANNGALAGAGGVSLGKDFAEIITIEVDPSAQGQGFGRLLMDKLIQMAEEAGLTRVLLEVAEANALAIGLYHSMGFATIDRRPGYYQPSGQDALVMELLL